MPPIRRVVQSVPFEKQNAYEDLLAASLANAGNGLIDYQLPYAKAEFLNYLCDWKGYVAHGSPHSELANLEPVRYTTDTTDFGKRRQVFGSPDAIWAMWFAILDKAQVSRTDNGCVRVGRGLERVKYYHFDLPKECSGAPPFVAGMLYFARPEDYPDRRSHTVLDWLEAEIEEWGSSKPVRPIMRVPVQPDEFPYLRDVRYRL